ncbi:dipeptidase [Fictibacillus fluitans]|uniref:Dipeptidase n=1 Tax=Fictibacillus fluitans TaxID=3058422 RepID=A0ABT8HTF1_9BACL|nr:dipeptidase [Fictibacillus sp. NE201]MDN4524033.1 dipeptidase [Fictibacillus sp. NE201]
MKNQAEVYPKRKRFVLDAHFDLLMDVQLKREKGARRVIEREYLEAFRKGGIHVIVAAVFVDSQFVPYSALQKALNQISCLYQEVKESPDKLMICLNDSDMLQAYETGKIGFLLSLEGAEPIGTDLSLLHIFYELGVRNLGLVWSRRNEAGDGSHFQEVREGKKGGLTSFGIELIEEAEKLGITIDVSHINDEGFYDVLEVAQKPLIASHSNARALCPTMRNLTDHQIKEIAGKKGVIGVNAVSMLVHSEDAKSTPTALADHIEYLIQLAGIEHVGFGFDFCDSVMKYISREDLLKMPRIPFDVIKGHQNLDGLMNEILKRGYAESDLALLAGMNFHRIFKYNNAGLG